MRFTSIVIFSSILIFSVIANSYGQIADIGLKNNSSKHLGIIGKQAPELDEFKWVDAMGKERDVIRLEKLKGKFIVIYCFQAWCPGCHSRGLPALKKLTTAFGDREDIVFLAIQTVFEGHHANTYKRMVEIQKQYDINIPFGHDAGQNQNNHRSTTMQKYRSGGTPWFIFIDKENQVVFNDFHIDIDKTISYLNQLSHEY